MGIAMKTSLTNVKLAKDIAANMSHDVCVKMTNHSCWKLLITQYITHFLSFYTVYLFNIKITNIYMQNFMSPKQ